MSAILALVCNEGVREMRLQRIYTSFLESYREYSYTCRSTILFLSIFVNLLKGIKTHHTPTTYKPMINGSEIVNGVLQSLTTAGLIWVLSKLFSQYIDPKYTTENTATIPIPKYIWYLMKYFILCMPLISMIWLLSFSKVFVVCICFWFSVVVVSIAYDFFMFKILSWLKYASDTENKVAKERERNHIHQEIRIALENKQTPERIKALMDRLKNV